MGAAASVKGMDREALAAEAERYRVPAVAPDRVNQRIQTILTPGDQNDVDSRLGQKAGDRLADSRTASGDDSSSVVEIKE